VRIIREGTARVRRDERADDLPIVVGVPPRHPAYFFFRGDERDGAVHVDRWLDSHFVVRCFVGCS